MPRLDEERDQLLAELRRTTGLGGTIRTAANDPADGLARPSPAASGTRSAASTLSRPG